ncbi:MAG TPA: phosphoribosylglycinamide formyltransferase [Cytophagales bacterium]|jgi:phosphoribosylglycinamide formyltransferase-1|nr:phosphoribosylglycinamide formyltransferase [Cytophagales bacterium]
MSPKKIAFFASGSGSNVENIVLYFREKEIAAQFLVLCNNPNAYVLQRADKLGIESIVFDKKALTESGEVLRQLQAFNPDLIVLAGFLWLMPASFVQAFPNRIVNIHPALLPKYGGKGMYGMRVHEAVVANNEKESGITIHYVNEHYDEGAYICQVTCAIAPHDSPEDVAQKVHQLEYAHFPKTIAALLNLAPL